MTITFYSIAIPPLIRGLKNLSAILTKGEAHAKANGIDPQVYLDSRLHPDMAALPFQIHRVSDSAKFVPVRCAGVEAPSFPDVEQTFPELQARITKTIEFLESVPESAFEGQEGREVVLQIGPQKMEIRFQALDYLGNFATPNFWFHITTAYGILRSKGVDVGKMDYLNGAKLTKTEA
ncbi:uncharacterized protein BDR25DRAFT_304020 [Lindgomyces ingoldianus]|uniref:Uncharacterized protein n=1 Tax=Lindgomyces ingoldianus TaxID=673940 RepID=A0ACB6QSS3_9PLEO|nr:uncharacterized protein BDR25DRAFT_304020 [Lindgomyces ingoldianus]KAF2470038.1 hypothetical protein BDR25DRAFT_304020 [Lindgomyces ingoldianus]